MTQPLSILYQDAHCIAINKPAGMLVHRSPIDKHETQFVMQTLRDQIGQYVYPIHRLDRPTSGVLLFALNSENAKFFSQQFEARQVKKTYLAVVRGWLDSQNLTHGEINYPLSYIKDKIADKHRREEKPEQDASTHWQVIATTEQTFQARARYPTSRYSLVELSPKTGRKHQLRRHMKHIFHPIIGDTSYGDHHQNRAIRTHVGVTRLMLHAHTLKFLTTDNKRVVVTAPLDQDWQTLSQHFNWQDLLPLNKS